MSANNTPCPIKAHPFHLKEPPFHWFSAAKAADMPIRTNNTVARNHQREGIVRQGCSDRPGCFRMADFRRQTAIGINHTQGNTQGLAQHILSETGVQVLPPQIVQTKDHLFSLQIGGDLFGNRWNLRPFHLLKTGPGAFNNLYYRLIFSRQKNLLHNCGSFLNGPDQSHLAIT